MMRLKIIDYTKEGLGIAKYDGSTIFVDNALVDEVVDVEVYKEVKNIKYANVIKFHEKSKNRVVPKCKNFFNCGGCHLMHMNYEEQLLVKKRGIKALINKNNIDIEDFEVEKSENILNYRNKITFTFFKDKNIFLGFNKRKTHEGIDVDSCLLIDDNMNFIKGEVVKIINKLDLSVYDKKTKKGILKNIIIKKNSLGKYMLILNTNAKDLSIFKEIKELDIDSIIINGINDKVVVNEKYLLEECEGIKYQISDEAFFQVNTNQMIKMYSDVKSLVNKGDRILDAYCGIGSIGLFLSSNIKSIVGIEINKSSIKDAKNNALLNGVGNAIYYCGDIKKIIRDIYKNDDFDTLIIDPPRKGIDINFINIIKDIKPRKIIYISCNASTLVRDLKLLEEIYNINYFKGYDMFSQTFHVETIVGMEKNDRDER